MAQTPTELLLDAAFETAIERDRLRKANRVLVELAIQYRDDLRHPVTDRDSIKRRLDAIDAAIAKAEAQ